MEARRNWSDNAKAIMKLARIAEERIESGQLNIHEQRMLQALMQAEQFLQVRYPHEKMTFTNVNNMAISTQTYLFSVYSDAAPDNAFSVKVTPGGNPNGTDLIQESRFNDVMHDQLQSLVQALLGELAVENVCSLIITGLYGSEYDPQRPLKELLHTGLLIDISGCIYVPDAMDAEALIGQLRLLLRREGLCSGISLVQVRDASLAEAAALPLFQNPYVTARHYVSLPATMSLEVE